MNGIHFPDCHALHKYQSTTRLITIYRNNTPTNSLSQGSVCFVPLLSVNEGDMLLLQSPLGEKMSCPRDI